MIEAVVRSETSEDRPFSRDEWLTQIVGHAALTLDVASERGMIERALEALKEPAFLTAKVDASDVAAVHMIEGLGFRLVSTQIRFSTPSLTYSAAGAEVAFASGHDEHEVAELAGRVFKYSRFHSDPLIETPLAHEIKKEWARSFFKGTRGEHMVVARTAAGVAGFLQLLHHPSGALVIDLIGVDRDQRGRGIARKLIAFAAEHCRPYETIDVGTQLSNVPSLRLYSGLGFRPYSSEHVFHLHWSRG